MPADRVDHVPVARHVGDPDSVGGQEGTHVRHVGRRRRVPGVELRGRQEVVVDRGLRIADLGEETVQPGLVAQLERDREGDRRGRAEIGRAGAGGDGRVDVLGDRDEWLRARACRAGKHEAGDDRHRSHGRRKDAQGFVHGNSTT
jgi:hypothetical protein